MPEITEPSDAEIDIIWGVDAIAKRIKRTPRETFYMLNSGQLPGKKVGGRWCTTDSALIAFFKAVAA